MRLELVEIHKATQFGENLRQSMEKAVRDTVREVHGDAVARAPIDTSRLRNNMIWSIDGKEYGGANQFDTTSPESPWGHKPGARPVGAPATMESPAALMKFPVNAEANKVIGYVGNNVLRDGHAPYGYYQEFGWTDKAGKVHVQPFFRPAVYSYGTDPTVRPRLLKALRSTKAGPLKIERVKK